MPYKYVEKKKKGPGHWDEKKKLEVIQAYILLGQLRLTAATCNIPEITVKYWKKQKWWKEMEDELRRSSKLQLSGKLSVVIEKSLSVVEDRLVNGDFVYNARLNEFVRKGVSAADASKITAQLIDRTLQIEKAAVPEKINEAGIETRLAQLRSEMLKFAKPALPTQFPKEVIDVEYIQQDRAVLQGPVEQASVQGGSESQQSFVDNSGQHPSPSYFPDPSGTGSSATGSEAGSDSTTGSNGIDFGRSAPVETGVASA